MRRRSSPRWLLVFVVLGSFLTVALLGPSLAEVGSSNAREPAHPPAFRGAGDDAAFASLQSRFLSLLSEFVAIPSVSNDAAHSDDVERAFEWLFRVAERCGAATGFRTVAVDGTDRKFAKIAIGPEDASAVVAVYAHLDVQPAGEWEGGDAFALRPAAGGRLTGRGVADDKAPLLTWLLAAADLHSRGELRAKVKFLVEGAEEAGSPGLEAAVAAEAGGGGDGRGGFLSDAQVVLVSDTYCPSRAPCLTTAVRGLLELEVEVAGGARELHSGEWGGLVRGPMEDLTQLLASLVDAAGRPNVAGLDPRAEAGADAAAVGAAGGGALDEAGIAAAAVEVDVAAMAREAGLSVARATALLQGQKSKGGQSHNAVSRDVLSALWLRPSLTVHGVEGAWASPGFKTVIPRRVVGKVSVRLVPPMNLPATLTAVEMHLTRQFARMRSPNTLSVRSVHYVPPWSAGSESGHFMLMAQRAIEEVTGVRAIYAGAGGTVPAVSILDRLLSAPLLLMPFGPASQGAHSGAEHVEVELAARGLAVARTFLRMVGGGASEVAAEQGVGSGGSGSERSN